MGCVKGCVVGAGGQLGGGARVPGALPGCRQPRDPVQSHPQLVNVQSLHHSTAREHRLRRLRQCLHRR